MPYKDNDTEVRAKLAVSYKGVKIYHVYKDDQLESGMHDYMFATRAYTSNPEYKEFDIREFRNWKPCAKPRFIEHKMRKATKEKIRAEWDKWWSERTLFKHCEVILKQAIALGVIQKIQNDEPLRGPLIKCESITGEVATFGVDLENTDPIWTQKAAAFIEEFGSLSLDDVWLALLNCEAHLSNLIDAQHEAETLFDENEKAQYRQLRSDLDKASELLNLLRPFTKNRA